MPMDVRTDTDRYIVEQIAKELQPGEEPLHAAYLTTPLGGNLASLAIVSLAKAKAYFAVLTAERLYLLTTRVGALRPLCENHGVEAIARTSIRGVSVLGRLAIKLDDGRKLVFAATRKTTHVSEQVRFLDALSAAYGSGEAAAQLRRQQQLNAVLGMVVAVAIAMAWGYYHFVRQRARVKVECVGAPEGIRCTLRHVSGGADTHTCWKVRVRCNNGARIESFACADVIVGGSADKLVPLTAFKSTDGKTCDGGAAMKVGDVMVKAL